MPSASLIGYDILSFSALVDSGSSNCFIDTTFINENSLHPYSVPPLQLCLFDGTTNSTITQAIDLSIHFSTGDITLMTFYITLLDGSCSLVLGYNWLTLHNLCSCFCTSLSPWRFYSVQLAAPTQGNHSSFHVHHLQACRSLQSSSGIPWLCRRLQQEQDFTTCSPSWTWSKDQLERRNLSTIGLYLLPFYLRAWIPLDIPWWTPSQQFHPSLIPLDLL